MTLQNFDMNVYKQIAERMKAEREEAQRKQAGQQTTPSQDADSNSPENTSPAYVPAPVAQAPAPVANPSSNPSSAINWNKFLPSGNYPANRLQSIAQSVFMNLMWDKSKKGKVLLKKEDLEETLLKYGASNQLNVDNHIEEIVSPQRRYPGLKGLIFTSDGSSWEKIVNPTTGEVSYKLYTYDLGY